jgi:parvulin-like peptidyl-prolyl isomerase
MYFRLFCVCLAVECSFGQLNAQESPTNGGAPSPDTVIAVVNGNKFTIGDYQQLLLSMTPQMRETAMKQPRAMLEQYALFQNILAEAEKSKLEQKTPYKERVAEARRQILVQARINEQSNTIVVSPDQVKKYYDENRQRYAEAKAKVLFISMISDERTLDGSQVKKREPEESKALADNLVAKLKGGADFAELAKQHSDDASTADKGADFPDAIRGTSSSVPQNVRDAVLNAAAGDIVGPLQHETGYYIFRIESVVVAPFDQVKSDIYNDIKQAGLTKWLEEMKARSSVTIEDSVLLAKPPEIPQQ